MRAHIGGKRVGNIGGAKILRESNITNTEIKWLCPGNAGRTLILLFIDSRSQDPSRYRARKRRKTLIDRPNHGEHPSLDLSKPPRQVLPQITVGECWMLFRWSRCPSVF